MIKMEVLLNRLIVLLFFVGINHSLLSQSQPDSLVQFEVQGNDTDPSINFDLTKRHQVFYNGTSQTKNTLLVHLVGTFDDPNSTFLFPSEAANSGFHCINLMYRNWTAAQTPCSASTDLDCYLNFRKEIIEGIDYSPDIAVNAANSINNRLLKLLQYLNANFPTQNWGQFYSGNNLEWQKMMVSGHSQGGGHAAVIAITKPIKRVLMFGSPNDYIDTLNVVAPWTSQTHIVPDSNYYGFNALFDEVADAWKQYAQWDALGLDNFGDTVDVTQSNYPFNNSRQLYTKQMVANPSLTNLTHNIMIRDFETPLTADGSPLYKCVWRYMLGLSCDLASVGEFDQKKSLKVFPNPTNHMLFVETNMTSNAENRVVIVDITGKIIGEYSANIDGYAAVDLSQHNQGIYIVQIFNQGVIIDAQKVIKR